MTTELDRFKTILATISLEHPEMKLGDALLLAVDIEEQMLELPLALRPGDPDWKNIESAAEWVRKQTTVIAYHSSGKKINAIKEIRSLAPLGLRNAKLLYEYAFEGHSSRMLEYSGD